MSQGNLNKPPQALSEFYDSLENLKSLNIWNIHKELATSGKLSKEWERKIITERKSLAYNINKGELMGNSHITDISGGVLSIKLSQSDIEYLKVRIQNTENTFLKSRYAHLLWQELKYHSYAQIAIDNYILTINTIRSEEARELPILLSAILFISKNSKQKLVDVKKDTIALINSVHFSLRPLLLGTILDNNIFKKEELNPIADGFLSWVEDSNPVSYFSIQNSIGIGLKLFKYLQKSPQKLYDVLANNEDVLLDQHKDDTNFVKYLAVGRKAEYLKKAGKHDEAQIVLKEYTRLKETVKLSKISTTLDGEGHDLFNKYLDTYSTQILKGSAEEILAFFALEESILVDPNENLENAQKSFNQSLSRYCSTSTFDINSNFNAGKETDEFLRQKLMNYNISFSIKCSSLFMKVCYEGIVSGKINYYNVFSFLETHTWYGTSFKRSMTSNEIDEKASWLTLIAPGLHHFFSQFELSVLMNTNKVNNFVLCLDSLTLKFEGALREFIKLSGGTTSKSIDGQFKEQLLDELLQNEITIKYFTEKDIELFKYAFTREGQNIRNNVAHSFLKYSDYTLNTVLLVILCLLRLGKYTFSERHN